MNHGTSQWVAVRSERGLRRSVISTQDGTEIELRMGRTH